jgi:hypothetical protein
VKRAYFAPLLPATPVQAIFVDNFENRFAIASSPAFRAHSFHPASRRRQVSVSGSVGLADLDIAAADVVIFVCSRRWTAGGRSCLFGWTLRLGFF